MIIGEVLREATAFLEDQGSPSARLDAEVLLAHSLGLSRVALYVHSKEMFSVQERQDYWALLVRRGRKEPVSYIVGYKEFFGLTFAVDRRVLIPRPETELLVERALDCARELDREDLVVADIGTGSGCIAVVLAQQLPKARVYAIEISRKAADLAKGNFRRHKVEDRVVLLVGDLGDPLPEPVDLLVSNPPYTLWETLPEGITAFEPRVALDGGQDGMTIYRRLLPEIPLHLRMGGYALLEVGDGQARTVLSLAGAFFAERRMRAWPDYSGVDRVVQLGPRGEEFVNGFGILT
jgi:release factor glutamine methyltransferase